MGEFAIPIILFLFAFMGLMVNLIIRSCDEKNAQKAQEEAFKKAQLRNSYGVSGCLQQRIDNFNSWRTKMYEQYGKADVCLQIKQNEPDWTILIWQAKKMFYYKNRTIKFADILDFKVSDNERIVPGQTIATTKTDVWSEIKRDAMIRGFGKTTGTWLAGPLKQNTEIKQTPDKVYHSYAVTLTINDFNRPILEIKIGEDKAITDKVVSLINIMIANK